ncbi:MAG TPA: HAMP domain-containing sensor histidine kinase [Ktedonobacteraceae bacterium]|jgi:two-component system OmpR family sensor kinase|nr:HAMP domain-containing sensor histidine kinase [Ktedonobacteraceae bacterium]
MRSIHYLSAMIHRIPLRWRLTLISLGLLTFLLGTLGVLVLFTAEQALLVNQALALRNEAHVATNGLKEHPFDLTAPPGTPNGHLSARLMVSATVLAQKITGPYTNAAILSPDGHTIVGGSNVFSPPIVLSSTQVLQQLQNQQSPNQFFLVHNSQKIHQLVVLIPLENKQLTVAILQLSTPITAIDNFITTLRITLLLGGLGALGLATFLAFPLIAAALRPLVEMERASKRIAEGKLSMRLDVPLTGDEIGHLAGSFNSMVAQLEEAFAHQKRFVADVSHELRTPLTALSGSLEMLLIGADKGDTEATRRLARGMYAEVQRMHRLVEDLLALTRLDEGMVILREDTINVPAIIDKVYDQAQQLARGQDIIREVSPDIAQVRADSDRLQQVLLNIVDNALKFTPEDGFVELLAYNKKKDQADDAVVIEIHDTGKGIPEEALPHVFDRFYRADPSRSRLPQKVGGNGLGLAIAKELIEAQRGTISIQSTLNTGTIVTIQLPAVSTAVVPIADK